MDALIVTAVSAGLALAVLLMPTVCVAAAMLAAVLLLIGGSAIVLAYLVGVPAANERVRSL